MATVNSSGAERNKSVVRRNYPPAGKISTIAPGHTRPETEGSACADNTSNPSEIKLSCTFFYTYDRMTEQIITYDQACVDSNELDIMVVSYGGSGSNTLTDYLCSLDFTCKSPTWHRILCHFPEPLAGFQTKRVYIYDDPRRAFMSQRRRMCANTNQRKLSNNNRIILSDENLLRLMIRQFMAWTRNQDENILIISKRDFFSEKRKKLFDFLNISPETYPAWKQPHEYDFNEYRELFAKYRKAINYINSYGTPQQLDVPSAWRRLFSFTTRSPT